MILRLVMGAALATIVAAAAARARLLSPAGAIAAAVVGAAAVAAGWSWGIVLVVFFVLTSALSAYGAERKRALTRGILAKGSTIRDATQVIANGEVFAVAGILWLGTGDPLFLAAGGGAIAAAAADSWATETGVAFGGIPRSIVSGMPMARGTSGGVTVAGFLGAAAGAAIMAGTMLLIGWPRAVAVAVFLGGMVGMVLDSVLGATLQAGQFCPDCETETEQPVHHCGRPTQAIRGVRWMDNDLVNLLATLSGAVIAAIFFVVST
ncbi:MAG: DUF92 domain-containing protein [Gemmatimonadaceae bacterium]